MNVTGAAAALLLLTGQLAPTGTPGETREFRYLMGTSVQIAARGAETGTEIEVVVGLMVVK